MKGNVSEDKTGTILELRLTRLLPVPTTLDRREPLPVKVIGNLTLSPLVYVKGL